MRVRALAVLSASLLATANSAFAAADPSRAARDMYGLFSDACVDNLAAPGGPGAWAAKHRLERIKDASAIKAFAGSDEGAVWEVSTGSNPFALALRDGGACAVYGDKVDIGVVEDQVKGLVEALKGTGRTVTKVKDDTADSDFGLRHSLIYVASGKSTMTVTLITDEKPGGLFQAAIQISERLNALGSSR